MDSKKIPPFNLRVKVHGALDENSFLLGGKSIKKDLDSIFSKCPNIEKIESFDKVLEFGCGCGRVLLWVEPKNRNQFFGTDIDKNAISWCKKNLESIKFETNMIMPPLSFPDVIFDAIYSISVFTHLNEKEQWVWLDELNRVLKPRGKLLVSIHGIENLKNQKHIERATKLKTPEKGFGFCEFKSPIKRIILGKSTNRLAYHSKKYILENYSKKFKIIDYVDNGINNHQDAVLLEKI